MCSIRPPAQNLGELTDSNGNPIVIEGLWALGQTGTTATGFDPVYFTAGLPDVRRGRISIESAGLFGDIALVPETRLSHPSCDGAWPA